MSIINDIKEQLNDLVIFKYISSAFTEASSVKLKNIRAQFERNRIFYEDLTYLYHLVEMAALKMKIYPEKLTSGKQLAIAVTSNSRFFGNLNNEVVKIFLKRTASSLTDLLVIGVTGNNYMKQAAGERVYQSIIFAKDNPTLSEIQTVLERCQLYDRVLVYYPRFISFLRQEIGIIDITQRDKSMYQNVDDEINILFEPELAKILNFFETSVRLLLIQRVLLETDLARTAARLLTMSQADEHADYEIKNTKIQLAKVVKSFLNAQLLDTFSSIRRWKDE